ncbi:hypothetical protein CGZ95_03375 [Enemella evansiae]|uniref:ester cyclase n=1 Tax=Enemella evansiae TaxID=2016499 RepID=UPI000B96A2DC|nr:ester cyclase [Enemella evansiae]OYO04924.1 hypothetical protein CGZ95_03375 [Enemella evansiae]
MSQTILRSTPLPDALVSLTRPGADADPGYTEQELANLDVIRRFRSASLAGRGALLAPGAVAQRVGMSTLAEVSGLGTTGYRSDSLSDRVDELTALIARDDVVWGVWSLNARHTGPLFGIPATGRRISITEVGIWRLLDQQIVEHWYFADELALLNQLGHLPNLPKD